MRRVGEDAEELALLGEVLCTESGTFCLPVIEDKERLGKAAVSSAFDVP